jgi:hypothetical protein
MSRWIAVFLCAAFVTTTASYAGDDGTDEIKVLRQLVEQQQALIKALGQRVEALESGQKATFTSLEEVQAAAELAPEKNPKPAMRSSIPVELYGYIKLDAAWDSNRASAGNFARWAPSDSVADDDDQFTMTARQSRFGLKFMGPYVGKISSSGRVEVDFYEGGAENKGRVMMRHAYMQLNWPDHDFSLIAGQTSDIISPLVPSTINYPVQWWAGNIGYRRPQLRLTKGIKVGEKSKIVLQTAATRTIGDNGALGTGIDTGQDAGFPTFQARGALSFPLLTQRQTTIGLSGHWGEEESDSINEDLQTWSINLDLNLPLTEKLTLKGEAFHGENLDAYLGGIAQGVAYLPITTGFAGEEIESSGGWFALDIGPFNKWRFGTGASIDDPEDDHLMIGARSQNASVWGNVMYSVNSAINTGLELSYFDTEYKGAPDGDNFRVQSSIIYKF